MENETPSGERSGEEASAVKVEVSWKRNQNNTGGKAMRFLSYGEDPLTC
jgi:hypothetical protein